MTFDLRGGLGAEPEPQFGSIIVSVGDGLGVLEAKYPPSCVVEFLDEEFHKGIYAEGRQSGPRLAMWFWYSLLVSQNWSTNDKR